MIELFLSLPINLKVLILAPLTLIVIEKIKEKL
jgi:hypothetical protein